MKVITEGRQEWDALVPYEEWGPLQVEATTSRESDEETADAAAAGDSHTHDGTGTASTVVGGTAEAGSDAPTASGTSAVALGDRAVASGDASISIGSTDGTGSLVETTASGEGAIAIGGGASNSSHDGAQATGTQAIAIGSGGNTNAGASAGLNAIAIGSGSVAPSNSTIIGTGASSTPNGGVAIGHQAAVTTGSTPGVAIGCSVSGEAAVGIGNGVAASATTAVAVGFQATATAASAVALGRAAIAGHSGAVALGLSTSTTDANQVSIAGRHFELTEISAPGTPAANQARIYLDSTSGNLSIKKDTGSVVDLETGGGSIAHSATTGQTTDDHHAKSHAHDGVDGSGTVAHSATTGQTANDHHNQAHALSGADHTGSLGSSQHPATFHAVALGPWSVVDAAASLANQPLRLGSWNGSVVPEVRVPYAGQIRALSVHTQTAVTAGLATVRAVINGTVASSLNTNLDTTNPDHNQTTVASGTVTFSAGDRLEIQVSTTGSWAPTNNDLVAFLWITMDII